MYFIAATFEKLVNVFAPVWGLSILVLPDATERSLFDFEYRSHRCNRRLREYFGLGLHFVVTFRR